MSNLLTRTITGVIFVTAVVSSILFQEQYYTFTLLFSVFNILALIEFYGIINAKENVCVNTPYMVFCGTLLYFGCFWCSNFNSDPNRITGFVILIAFILSIIILIISELYRGKPPPTYNLAFSIYGQAVVALPFAVLNFIARDTFHLLALFAFIWLFDTGAYLFGSTFGKHKMIERISPKKSWEGEIGGALTTIGAAIGYSFYIDQPLWQWVVFALIVVIFGTFGDLSESMLKRASGLKDSGTILPGHGGMLDRFDSMLLAAPVIYIYVEILKAVS